MVKVLVKRILSSLAWVLLLASIASAQTTGKLTGTVVDPSGAVIPEAEITAKDAMTGSEYKAMSDKQGVWVKSVPSGSYTVTVSAAAAGFGKMEFPEVNVGPGAVATVNTTLQISLEFTVETTTSRREEEIINAPATVTVIPELMIQALPTQNSSDLFRAVPGMNVVQMSAVSYGITSRTASGAAPTGQLALVDGRTIYVGYSGAAFYELTPILDDFKQVEVIRGPASAVWGSYAMNGVVNIITKTPGEMVGTTFTLGIGTFDRSGGAAKTNTGSLYYARATHAQVLNDSWAYKITGGYYTQDAFARPQGAVPNDYQPPTPYPPYTNTGTTQPKFDARVDYDHPDGKQHLSFAGGFLSSNGLVPGGAGALQNEGKAGYGKVDYFFGSLRISGYIQPIDFSGTMLLFQDQAGKPVKWDGRDTTYHLEFADYRTAASRHLISYGGNFRHAGFKDLTFAPDVSSRNEGGAYIQDEVLLSDHFRWTVGARIDKFDNVNGVVVSPRTTFIIKPVKGQTFRASYNRAYVAPSVYYTNRRLMLSKLTTIDLGGGNYYRLPFCFCGNTDLDEISLNAYEVGYSAVVANGRLNLGAAFYINDTKGQIIGGPTYYWTSENPPPGWPLPPEVIDYLQKVENTYLPREFTLANATDKVTDKGLELSADARFNRYITAYANYSWQARPESEMKDLDLIGGNLPPANRFNAGMDFDYKRYLGNISVGYVGRAFFSDIIGPEYSGWTKAYTAVNLGAGVRWGGSGRYTAMLRVSNLGNTKIQNHIYGDILKRQISGEFKMSF